MFRGKCMSPTSLNSPIVDEGCIYNLSFFACVWLMRAIFHNLSPSLTLKMGSRSPKSNQFLSLSQQYSCTSLVKIHSFILEKGCTKTFSKNLSPPVTLKVRSRSPTSNQFFYMPQEYYCASLVKIHLFLHEIGCR